LHVLANEKIKKCLLKNRHTGVVFDDHAKAGLEMLGCEKAAARTSYRNDREILSA